MVPEPVEKWQAVRGAPGAPGPAHNMLDAFYKEPQRYAYTFQNYVFLTRVMQARAPPPGRELCGAPVLLSVSRRLERPPVRRHSSARNGSSKGVLR